MKYILLSFLFSSISIAQGTSLYMGAGMVNADIDYKIGSVYDNPMTKDIYYQVGYDVESYTSQFTRFGTMLGMKYIIYESDFGSHEDNYSMMLFNVAPKFTLKTIESFSFNTKLRADIKIFEFYAGKNNESTIQDQASVLRDGFDVFQLSAEAAIEIHPQWMEGYRLELSYHHPFGTIYDDGIFQVKPRATFTLTIFTPAW